MVPYPKTPLSQREYLLNRMLQQTFPFPDDQSAPVPHMERVGKLSGLLSETLDGMRARINALAGYKHDIGKARIPNAVEVLTYKGKLSVDRPEWWLNVLEHPIYSVDLLLEYTPEIAIPILEIVRHHHESLAGDGYPDRLEATKIPYGSSILTVADTFDAMTIGGIFRSYGNRVSPQEAIDHMMTGEKYDKKVVQELNRLLNERSGSKRISKIYERT